MKVELSYEERIMNAIAGLPYVRGERLTERGQREHAAIRAILQPLYESAARAEAAERLNGELVAALEATTARLEQLDHQLARYDSIVINASDMRYIRADAHRGRDLLTRIESASTPKEEPTDD